jgi:hypothetical protein
MVHPPLTRVLQDETCRSFNSMQLAQGNKLVGLLGFWNLSIVQHFKEH